MLLKKLVNQQVEIRHMVCAVNTAHPMQCTGKQKELSELGRFPVHMWERLGLHGRARRSQVQSLAAVPGRPGKATAGNLGELLPASVGHADLGRPSVWLPVP